MSNPFLHPLLINAVSHESKTKKEEEEKKIIVNDENHLFDEKKLVMGSCSKVSGY